MKIVLIGYRGTGKSAVARVLAEKLRLDIVSTDEEIVKKAGMPIPDIVSTYGWEHFRDLESEVCRSLGTRDGVVVDCGGGAVLRPENVSSLKRNGFVFWLRASVSTIRERIKEDAGRPSLTGKKSFLEEVTEVLREREPGYRNASDRAVETDGRSVQGVADEIISLIGKAGRGQTG